MKCKTFFIRLYKAHVADDELALNNFLGDIKVFSVSSSLVSVGVVGTGETVDVSAMGYTVNLAARCAGRTKGPHAIRIATDDIGTVEDVFKNDVWELCPPVPFEPKNMTPVLVVDVRRTTE